MYFDQLALLLPNSTVAVPLEYSELAPALPVINNRAIILINEHLVCTSTHIIINFVSGKSAFHIIYSPFVKYYKIALTLSCATVSDMLTPSTVNCSPFLSTARLMGPRLGTRRTR